MSQSEDQAEDHAADAQPAEDQLTAAGTEQNQIIIGQADGQMAAIEAGDQPGEDQLTVAQTEQNQIIIGQGDGQMASVQAGDQIAIDQAEGQSAIGHTEGQMVSVGQAEGQMVVVQAENQIATAAAESAGGVVVQEQQVIHLTEVDEHIRNHMEEMENQLRQNVEAVQSLQEQNQEIRSALDTSNASLVLLQAEVDSRKAELEKCKEDNKKSQEILEKKLFSCQQELEVQTAQGDQMEQELLEAHNSLEKKEQEVMEMVEKYQVKTEEPAPGRPARVHNTRSRSGTLKPKSFAAATTPTKKTRIASVQVSSLQSQEKKTLFEPSALRFCRTCGSKQLFRVKPELLDILSGKIKLSNRTCAICKNVVSPPKGQSKAKDGLQEENEKKTPAKEEKMAKAPSRVSKKRKISEETEEKLDSDATGDKSDKENEGENKDAPLISYPVEDTPDPKESGDLVGDKSEAGTREGSEATGDEDGDDAAEPMDTREASHEPQEKKPLVFPTNRRPGRPKKVVKEKKSKEERTPSDAPVSEELAPLCDATDTEGTMFIDGRKKANRLTYAMLGLDEAVKEMMDPDAKPEFPFKCKHSTCKNVEFAHVKPFLKHMTTHTGEAPMSHPYRCQECNKTFKQSRVLQVHSMSHNDDRPFKCRFCPAAFKVRSGIWRHVKIHTNPKQHLCNICGQRFQEKRKLQNHEMIHSGELPYKCQHCGEGFRRIESMRRHEKTHTGERPHVCEFCGRSFKERGDIKKHLVLHTGEKPFKCTLCSYRSNRKEYVKLHMKTHGAGNIFKCPHCEMTFSSQLVCKKHEKEHYEPAIKQDEVVATEDDQKDKVQGEIIPTTLIIKPGDHPHQEMLSAVDFLLQFDSANRVFASSTPGQDGTVTYVTQNAATEGQEPTVAYVTQGEIAEGQEGMVTYVAQHSTSETGQETVTYVTETTQPDAEGETTTVAYITTEPNPEGGDHEATITYVAQAP